MVLCSSEPVAMSQLSITSTRSSSETMRPSFSLTSPTLTNFQTIRLRTICYSNVINSQRILRNNATFPSRLRPLPARVASISNAVLPSNRRINHLSEAAYWINPHNCANPSSRLSRSKTSTSSLVTCWLSSCPTISRNALAQAMITAMDLWVWNAYFRSLPLENLNPLSFHCCLSGNTWAVILDRDV